MNDVTHAKSLIELLRQKEKEISTVCIHINKHIQNILRTII